MYIQHVLINFKNIFSHNINVLPSVLSHACHGAWTLLSVLFIGLCLDKRALELARKNAITGGTIPPYEASYVANKSSIPSTGIHYRILPGHLRCKFKFNYSAFAGQLSDFLIQIPYLGNFWSSASFKVYAKITTRSILRSSFLMADATQDEWFSLSTWLLSHYRLTLMSMAEISRHSLIMSRILSRHGRIYPSVTKKPMLSLSVWR